MILFRTCSLIKYIPRSSFSSHIAHTASPNAILSTFYAIVFTLYTIQLTHTACVLCIHIIIIWNSEWNILTRNYTYQAWKAIKNRCDMVVFRISFRMDAKICYAHSHQIHSFSIAHTFFHLTFLSLSLSLHLPPHPALWELILSGCLALALACLSSCRYYACE